MSSALERAAFQWGRWWGSWVYRAPDERKTCPACDSTRVMLLDALPLQRRSDQRRVGFVSGCRECGILFANPFPSLDALNDFYSPEGEFRRRRTDDEGAPRPLSMSYLPEFFAPVRSWLDVQHPPPGARVLDIGCGNGRFLDAFGQLGWETWGIEPSGGAAFTRHRPLTQIPQDASFHVVLLHHVLEHVGQPLEMLRAAAGALRDRGVVAISVPRLDALPVLRDFRYCINSHTHIVSYTSDCLMTLLGRAGLSGITVSPPLEVPPRKEYMLRRLQVLGVKGEACTSLPEKPLDAAKRALRLYQAGQGARTGTLAMPVRVRAARLNRQRLAGATAPREGHRL